MTDGLRWSIEILSGWGMTGRTIARSKLLCSCSMKKGTCSHIRQVYKVCKDAGIRLRDYSQGKNLNARSVHKLARRRKAG